MTMTPSINSARLQLLSCSAMPGTPPLLYAYSYMDRFLGATSSMLFVPYAQPNGFSNDKYFKLVRHACQPLNRKVTSIHNEPDPVAAINAAEALFVGGGNTFRLLKTLEDLNLMDVIRARIASGMLYIGSSAGSNIVGLTIGTTNDMPIVQPASHNALRVLPFNFNPHYPAVNPDPKASGENRDTRIREFHRHNDQPVVGLREGSILEVENGELLLTGVAGARVFLKDQAPSDFEAGDQLTHLLGSQSSNTRITGHV